MKDSESGSRTLHIAALIFLVLVIVGGKLLSVNGLAGRVQGHFLSAYSSFVLLAIPIWFFGFGVADHVRRLLRNGFARVSASALLAMPYAVFALPAHQFRWRILAGFLLICLAGSALLEWARREHGTTAGGWQDFVVLATLGLSVDLRAFESAWPYPGVSGISKLVLVDLALYGYLVIRQLEGVGYDLRPKLSDIKIGLREFLYLAPAVLVLGLSLHFLHWHATMPAIGMIAGAGAFTFLFIAIPEELFFRGLVENLLERRWGNRAALALTSLLFGLSHFNKRLGTASMGFNWRYVLLATIAGIFYGRSWLAKRRIMASAITHTSVDVTWAIWLR